MKHLPLFLVCWLGCTMISATVQAEKPAEPISVEQLSGKCRVTIGDQVFAEVDFENYEKPIVYPIYGPHQIPMTRNYPMKQDVAGEATDHPHHKSMWFGHGDVNGISFWHGEGKIETEKVEVDENPQQPRVTLHNKLIDPQGQLVCRETVVLRFSADASARIIDWESTLHAGETPVKLGDTKEGTMAIRTHPNLRLSNGRGVTTANGQAVNSEGVTGRAIWGKRADWVDYWGQIQDQTVGIAIFDHPQNLRHPTYWHARDYGLVAANPFGASQFAGQGHDGTYTIAPNESLQLRYRFVFHLGDVQQARIAQRYSEYAQAAGQVAQ